MEIANTKKLVAHIVRLLKVSYIDFPIGRTSKGNLALKFDDSGDFTIMLDSVPLSTKNSLEDENNIELKKMIEKYWFDERTLNGSQFRGTSFETKGPFIEKVVLIEELVPTAKEVKKRGRPAGSKNKGKDTTTKEEVAG